MNWQLSSQLYAPGYYWCRLGPDDPAPTVMSIEQTSDRLVLYEFGFNEAQNVRDYSDQWQFKPLSQP